MSSTLPLPLSFILPLLLYAGALPRSQNWRSVQCLNGMAFTLAGLGALVAFVNLHLEPTHLGRGLTLAVWGHANAAMGGVAVLVTFLSFILVRYCEQYLAGERSLSSFIAQLQLTMGSVLLVVLANHLAVIIVGWIAISLGLHRLLLFYPDRVRAVLAAHKKFLLARAAEVALVVAGLLLYAEYGTWNLTQLMALIEAQSPGLKAQFAAILLVQTALIKCAQLPLHGWLIQVVEAPTPVSALLHAGVINLGGILLILFAPLLSQVPVAQWWLLLVAGSSTVLAVLVMSVEKSIKVQLAWSTSAQMGLMLMECALGLYHVAILHLLAHSCYKAWSFLAAGTRVARPQQRRAPAIWATPLAAITSLAVVMSLPPVLSFSSDAALTLSSRSLLAALLFTVLLEALASKKAPRMLMATLAGLGMLMLYLGLEHIASQLTSISAARAGSAIDLVAAALIAVMTLLWWVIRQFGSYPAGVWLQHKLYRGLYLDEWFTIATLRLCPVRLPNALALATTQPATPTQECL